MTDDDKALYLRMREGENEELVGGNHHAVPFYFKVYKSESHTWEDGREYLFQSMIKEGVSLKDVADKVGISYGNAKMKLHRLKKAGFDCGDLKKKWDHEKVVMLLFLKDNVKCQDKVIADSMGLTLASVKSKIKEIRDGRKQNA